MKTTAPNRIACVLSPTNVRRLMPGMRPFAHQGREFWHVDHQRPVAAILQMLRFWKPGGILIDEKDTRLMDAIRCLRLPTVVVPLDDCVPCGSRVDVDDVAVGRMAAEHLIDKGLKHFGFWGEPRHYSHQREQGFGERLAASGHEFRRMDDRTRTPREFVEYWVGHQRGLVAWLRQLPKPVGIFAAHDPLGRILVEVCAHEGLRVPDDVAVIAVNNDELICEMAHPPLSSIAIPWERIGFEAARLLFDLIGGLPGPAGPILVPPSGVLARLSSDMLAIDDRHLVEAIRYLHAHAYEPIDVNTLVHDLRVPRRSLERQFRAIPAAPRPPPCRVRHGWPPSPRSDRPSSAWWCSPAVCAAAVRRGSAPAAAAAPCAAPAVLCCKTAPRVPMPAARSCAPSSRSAGTWRRQA